jgi:hypothetical protein
MELTSILNTFLSRFWRLALLASTICGGQVSAGVNQGNRAAAFGGMSGAGAMAAPKGIGAAGAVDRAAVDPSDWSGDLQSVGETPTGSGSAEASRAPVAQCTSPVATSDGAELCVEGYSHRPVSSGCARPTQACTTNPECADPDFEYCACTTTEASPDQVPGSGFCTAFGDCRSDGDCPAPALCMSFRHTYKNRCQRPEDECFTDADCGLLSGSQQRHCVQDAGQPSRCVG